MLLTCNVKSYFLLAQINCITKVRDQSYNVNFRAYILSVHIEITFGFWCKLKDILLLNCYYARLNYRKKIPINRKNVIIVSSNAVDGFTLNIYLPPPSFTFRADYKIKRFKKLMVQISWLFISYRGDILFTPKMIAKLVFDRFYKS